MKFIKEDNNIILEYSADSPVGWISGNLLSDGVCPIKKVFMFSKEEYLSDDENTDNTTNEYTAYFLFAKIDESGRYYKIRKEVLGIPYDVYFDVNIVIQERMFISAGGVSIFKRIGQILRSDFYIGSYDNSSISEDVFNKLIAKFPTQHELKKYANARVSSIIQNHFGNIKDAKLEYDKYLNKKESRVGTNVSLLLNDSEKGKYQLLLSKLKEMLANEQSYNEKQWQNEILQILQLLYPKYIAVFDEVKIKDTDNHDRRLDFLLLDANGNIDILEIKKPNDNELLASYPYRDNYIPLRDLSGAVMQIEKYIYYLNKWGNAGEKVLSEKYNSKIPDGISINKTNPQGIIIMGREHKYKKNQLSDLEIIKRKYKNIIDILSYDDLLRRLDLIIGKFSK